MKPIVVLALITATLFVLSQTDLYSTEASTNRVPAPENYDIRDDASARAALERIRGPIVQRQRRTDVRFKIEYNDTLDIAEVIAPNGQGLLAQTPARRTRADVLKDFVSANQDLFSLTSLDQLHLTADYRNPDGNLAFVRFEQRLNGIPVFGAELKAGFSRSDELFRVINNLALAINEAPTDFATPESAIIKAAAHVGVEMKLEDLVAIDGKHFSSHLLNDTIGGEQFYFPVGNGVAIPSWRIHMPTPNGGSFYIVVDSSGTLLWRKNLIEHQTAPATYNPYITVDYALRPLQTAESPAPSPGCNSPTCSQPSAIARNSLTLIGNEAPYTFNDLGWIPDTGLPVRTPANNNITDGNNVETGIDRQNPNGIDENGWATGSPTRVFNYTYNPAPGLPPPGEEPIPTTQTYPPSAFQQGAITHGFYLINRWHDEMYRFGFTEQAGNFQHFNFGRGGAEGDRVSFEIQDMSGTNAANFSVAADGARPRLQMFTWTGGIPDRDGALDSQVVVHEMTHGLSSRLIGNTTGLNSNMSRGMGEGWSDFYAFALLSIPLDSPFSAYSLAGYASYLATPGFESNYYYGIRRFPVAAMRFRGPNGLPHNPLTLRYINAGCDALIGTSSTNPNSAYPRNPLFGVGTSCDQVHNLGEVWAVTLWEVRAQLIQRIGANQGNRRAIQYITDGMKLSPLNPTVVQMRDSILAAINVSDPGDVPVAWRGFATRGLGHGAAVVNPGTGSNNTVVTESFLLPPEFRRPARADFDGDGRTDISVFRPSDRVWYLNRSTTGFAAAVWGLSTDQPVPDDYDGDGKHDLTVFRGNADGSMPDFYVLRSTDSTISFISWGTTGDIGLSDDFDGDNKADHVIYRPSSGQFWVRRSSDGAAITSPFIPGAPLTGDYDGDARADFWTFSNGTWRIMGTGVGSSFSIVASLGIAGDKPVPADYDGDGRDDLAYYRPSSGTWEILNSTGGQRIERWGLAADVPAPGDYDGDGKADLAVYRDGVWWVNQSTSGIFATSFGLAGDKPLPASYYP